MRLLVAGAVLAAAAVAAAAAPEDAKSVAAAGAGAVQVVPALASSAPEPDGGEAALRGLAGKPATKFPPSVHRCVHSATKLAKQTKADNPCMNCDPAADQCNPGCQVLIDGLYHVCSGMCLPDGYYFDPQSQMEGCFAENKDKFKIAVEKCGCNSGFSSRGLACLQLTVTLSLALAAWLLLL